MRAQALLLLSSEACWGVFWVMTYSHRACQKRVSLHCSWKVVLIFWHFLYLFPKHLLFFTFAAFVLALLLWNNHWKNRVRDFISEIIGTAADNVYVSVVRSPESDPNCSPPGLANADRPTAAPTAGQTNQWEDESSTQQYSEPFMYFYLLFHSSSTLVQSYSRPLRPCMRSTVNGCTVDVNLQ